MDLNESVVESHRIHEGRIVNLRVDTVVLPDGRTAQREIVEHSGAIAAVPVDNDGRVLLVRQFRLAAGRPLLEIPAGGMEEGEDPAECAVRECAEEIGRVPGRLTPLFSAWVAPGYATEIIHCFLAEDLVTERKDGDVDEFVEVVPATWTEIDQWIADGSIQDMKSIAALAIARTRLTPPR
ncbi:MAG: NUDIX hydrolase [Armatimonadota bacterium]